MMLTVHGLPPNTKFHHVKALIKQECNIPDFILDNLVEDEYNSKKVRIGLTNETDGYRLMKCLQGFRMSGSHVLSISRIGEPPTQSQPSFEQRSSLPASGPQQQSFEGPSYNQPRNDYQNQSRSDYPGQDYNKPGKVLPSHISPQNSTRPGDTRDQPYRSFVDARQPSSVLSESRQNRYKDDKRPDAREPTRSDTRGSDYRDLSRRPLSPPAIRPASLDARNFDSRKPTARLNTHQHGFDTGSQEVRRDVAYRGPNVDTRGPNSSYDPRGPNSSHNTQELRSSHNTQELISSIESRPIGTVGPRGHDSHAVGPRESNPEMIQQPQWTAATNEWTNPTRPMQSQNAGYNYQQSQGNSGYGQQPTIHPNGSQSYQGKAPMTQHYQQPKIPATAMTGDVRTHVLRSVEIVDAPIQPRAAPAYPSQQKPITIMKDNFQGPTQYNVTGQVKQAYQAPAQAAPSPWAQPAQPVQTKPLYDKPYDDRRGMDKSKLPQEYDKRRISPARGRMDSPERRSPPRNVPSNSARAGHAYPERRISPPRPGILSDRHGTSDFNSRRMSPAKSPNRRVSPPRKVSPRCMSPRRSPVRKISPGRRFSPGRRISPSGRRISPSGRRISPSGRRISPSGRRISPSGRRISPSSRRISPSGRRISPSGRRISPLGRRLSPASKRISPGRHSPGLRMSPGRRISPYRKRPSPGPGRNDRRISPSMTRHDYYVEDERRMGGRVSPRRYSPERSPRGSGRYSPSTNYETDKGLKPIRPAYEANKAQKYTGPAFRANEPQYPAGRSDPKMSPWHSEKMVYPVKKDDRETPRDRPMEKKPSPRRSRSRSPVKDRYRRHSPSPRSPRRSWALEKRRSPELIREPPPPPLWPGQEEEKPKMPVWEPPDTRFDSKRDNYTPRFSPRRDDSYRQDYNERGDYQRPAKEPHTEKKLFNEIDKDFNDIYQRSIELRRKTEERKSHDIRNKSYDRDEIDKDTRLSHEKKPVWIPIKIVTKDVERKRLEPHVKEKRDKAIAEIGGRILEQYDITGEHKRRVMEELKTSLWNILMEMFDDKDVSYIELVIKFRARYDTKDEEKILQEVMTSLPIHYQNIMLKRDVVGITKVDPKVSKRLPAYGKEPSRPKLSDSTTIPEFVAIEPPKVVNMPLESVAPPVQNTPLMVQPPMYVNSYQIQQQLYQQSLQNMHSMQANMQSHMPMDMQPHMHSMDIPPQIQPHMQSMNIQPQFQPHMQSMGIQPHMQSMDIQPQIQPESAPSPEDYNLYLCQDDFEPFTDNQAEKLRKFLVSQMFKASESGNGWAPDFALKGLHSPYRYELVTRDRASKDWMLTLDFSDFDFFNVLVYTKEELWYERAAIWLPGHSRYRNIEPLEKLQLQNIHVDGIQMGKWKFVKKIVTPKGTRLYVDMPPSAARALEKKKMMLSYELGKVNVYLKAVAVDKDVFDAGLKDYCITDPGQLAAVVKSCVMPTISSKEVGLIRVTLNGAKSLTNEQVNKLKEMIIYNLFKYHETDGKSKTDFTKHGFCPPNCFGIVPENRESKRWLLNRTFGKLQRQSIIVLEGEDANTKYFRMKAYGLPESLADSSQCSSQYIIERLKQSNRGIKGLNFHYWKPLIIRRDRSNRIVDCEFDVDLESTETLIRLHFKLDFIDSIDQTKISTVTLKSDYSTSKLEEKIKKYKAEQADSYDVTNMELDSGDDSE